MIRDLFDQVKKRSTESSLGIRFYEFSSNKFSYRFEIIEGRYVTYFFMLSVHANDEDAWSRDMITRDQINYKNVIKLFKDLRNEVGE